MCCWCGSWTGSAGRSKTCSPSPTSSTSAAALRILSGTLAGSYSPTGEGKFFFTVMAAFAELERDMIHQRTMAGLAAAHAHGRVGGRPSVMNRDKVAAATARLARGEGPTEVAKALGVSHATLHRHTDVTAVRGGAAGPGPE